MRRVLFTFSTTFFSISSFSRYKLNFELLQQRALSSFEVNKSRIKAKGRKDSIRWRCCKQFICAINFYVIKATRLRCIVSEGEKFLFTSLLELKFVQ